MNDECPICADVRRRLEGLPESKLDGEEGLAAATMRGYNQLLADREAAENVLEAGSQLRQEIFSAIRRYGKESGLSVYQALGALQMVGRDLQDMLDRQKDNPLEGDEWKDT